MRLAIILLLVILAACLPITDSESLQVSINTDQGSVAVHARIADTPDKHSKGLMNVSYLDSAEGMLFLFKDSKVRSFWMKNTLIPLDMIFINDKKQVAYIVDGAQPATGEPYSIYSSQVPISYVLEVNAGFSKRIGLEVGDSLSW